MRNLFLVMRREYTSRLRSPLFAILTVLVAVLIVGGSILVNRLMNQTGSDKVVVTVLDQTGWALPGVEAALKGQAEGGVTLTKAEGAATDLEAKAKAGEVKLLLVLAGTDPNAFEATFFSASLGGLGRAQSRLGPVLEAVVRGQRVMAVGADPKVVQILAAPVTIKSEFLAGGGEAEIGARIGVASAFMGALYGAILVFCSFVLQGVLEEKTSRVAEVLVAAVRPVQLMAGKVMGIGLLGLTQLVIWAGSYLGAQRLGLPMMKLEAAGVSSWIWAWLILFYILGFFLYASLFAAAGASINRLEESQAAMLPLMVPIMVAYFLSFAALQDPTGRLAQIGSFVPFTAPTVMLTRLLLGAPAPWEVALSILLLILSGIGLTWVAARIYRAGILRFDGRLSWRASLQALRAKNL
jgi:ABC-2 type transport system permease protein